MHHRGHLIGAITIRSVADGLALFNFHHEINGGGKIKRNSDGFHVDTTF